MNNSNKNSRRSVPISAGQTDIRRRRASGGRDNERAGIVYSRAVKRSYSNPGACEPTPFEAFTGNRGLAAIPSCCRSVRSTPSANPDAGLRPFDWPTYHDPGLFFFVIPIYIKDKLMFVAVEWIDGVDGTVTPKGGSSARP